MSQENTLQKVIRFACIAFVLTLVGFHIYLIRHNEILEEISKAWALLQSDNNFDRSVLYLHLFILIFVNLGLLVLFFLSIWQLLAKKRFGFFKALMWLSIPQVFIKGLFAYHLFLGPIFVVLAGFDSLGNMTFATKILLFQYEYSFMIIPELGPMFGIGINFVPILILFLIHKVQRKSLNQ